METLTNPMRWNIKDCNLAIYHFHTLITYEQHFLPYITLFVCALQFIYITGFLTKLPKTFAMDHGNLITIFLLQHFVHILNDTQRSLLLLSLLVTADNTLSPQ